MEAAFNQQNENQSASFEAIGNDKSELMQIFEAEINDSLWAYRDLVKEILNGEAGDC